MEYDANLKFPLAKPQRFARLSMLNCYVSAQNNYTNEQPNNHYHGRRKHPPL
jgi:deoxycytidine triphosphate deaminase